MPDYQFNTNLGPAPQQGTSLGDLINTARGVQAYQQAEQLNPLALQRAQMEIQQAQQVNPLEVQAKQMAIEQAQKLNPLAVQKAQEEVNQAQTTTKKGLLGLSQDQTKIINENIGSVLNDERLTDPNPQRRAIPLIEARQNAVHGGVDPVLAEMMFAPLLDKAMRDQNPTAVKDMLSTIGNRIQSGIGATGQQALQTPGVTTNAAGQLVGVSPIKNKVNVLGEAPSPVSANPSQAQANLVNKAAEVSGGDYASSVQDATGAQGRIATFQNIKRLAPEAFTGVGGERKKLISGIAQAVGIPAYELETSSTDELSKNTKLLALTGGNTDAARGIAELASPNAKMTKEAIDRVADQLIGIEKMKLAKIQFLSPYVNNPTEYANKLMQFGQIADFRLFQEATPQEVAKARESMSPAARAEMSQKIQMARQLGVIK